MTNTAAAHSDRRQPTLLALLIGLAGCVSTALAAVSGAPLGIERLPDGHTLIAHGSGYGGSGARAIEVDSTGRLAWAYLKCDVPFLHTARRLPNGNTLMSSSYGNRVVEVNAYGDTVWTLSSGLSYPNDAFRLASGNTLITDRDNNRVIEVNPQRDVVWSYSSLAAPHNGNRLAGGNTLITDSDNNRVIEVDPAGAIVWQYAASLSWPRSAQRLDNGNTLIADTRNGRIIEVDSAGAIVWSATGRAMPFAAVRLAGGNTLVSEATRVVELTPSAGVAWQYPTTSAVTVETLRVTNPTSGSSLYVHIHRPLAAGPEARVPGIIFVPDTNGYGSSYDTTDLPDNIASDGFALLHFDPDGRGQSSSYPENYGGYVHQDGLAACLSLLASRPYVDPDRIGIYSRAYGIAMASGALARHSEPRVKFLIDVEGPADRTQACRDSGGYVPVPAESDSFWQEREAARFMKRVPAAYLRIQTAVDRNPLIPDNHHCIQLLDSATAVAHGGAGISPWTRLNDSVMNPANQIYTPTLSPPVWIPEAEEPQNFLRVLLYLHELADMRMAAVSEPRPAVRLQPLRTWPSPGRGRLRVALPAIPSPNELKVHDACGRLVRQIELPAARAETELDLRGLRPGVYYLSSPGAGTAAFTLVR